MSTEAKLSSPVHGDAVEIAPSPVMAAPSDDAFTEKERITAVEVATDSSGGESLEEQNDANIATKSTPDDAEGMKRMGRSQQLVRHFRLLSVASFVAIATAAWEICLFTITPALTDGGRPVLIYSVIWNFIGFGPIYLSMAEMASMAPIAGAQYHWVSEFAPESIQRILSYITGWTSTLAWQAGNAIGVFLVGTLLQSIISINDTEYAFPPWHATLLVVGAVLITYVGNVYGSKILPYWQNAVFVVHVVAFFAFIIPIWVNAPRVSHREVWGEFANNGGWSSMGLTVLVGQLTGIYTQVGIDTVAHMSEEVKDASKSVPRAMITVYIVNFCICLPSFLTIAYHIPSVEDSLMDPTFYPTIYVLRQAMSPAWITVLLVITVLLLIASNITYMAAVTRDLFAFGRDNGLPFSNWFAKIDQKRSIPANACVATSIVAILLALIYIGSTVAFYAITSLLTVALLQCYCVSIGCVLWRRIARPETLPPSQFSLGKFGIPINALAVTYSLWCFFWCFWPQVTPVTPSGFNWASVIFAVTLIGAMIYFAVAARHRYFGPVTLVEGRKLHGN